VTREIVRITLAALAVSLALALPAEARSFTCAQVILARDTLPRWVINSYIAKATPAEIAKGKRCLMKAGLGRAAKVKKRKRR
jgi:hypothetical protein